MADLRLWSIVACAALSSCQNDLADLETETEPLFSVRARIPDDLRLPQADETNALAGAILWAGVPVFNSFCHERGPTAEDPDRQYPSSSTVAKAGCRSPFLIVPGRGGAAAPIDPDERTFEVVLDRLPEVDVMVGTPSGRVAYGALVVFRDEAPQDSPETLPPPPSLYEFPSNPELYPNLYLWNFALVGLHDPSGDEVFEPTPAAAGQVAVRDHALDIRGRFGETLLASSFWSLEVTQIRVVYSEGEFDADSTFYPHPGCTTLPPAGFSLWEVGPLFDSNATCRLLSPDEVIQLEPIPDESRRAASCRPSIDESFAEPPPESFESIQDLAHDCTEDGEYVVLVDAGRCLWLRRFALVGCHRRSECETPDWDLRDDPPFWWDCPLPEGP